MANYNISKVKLSVANNGTTSNSEIPASGEMIISPKPGFVVGAASFTYGNFGSGSDKLVLNVSDADTGTAYTVGNTVRVTLNFNSDFTMPDNDVNYSISVSGDARRIEAANDFAASAIRANPFNITINNNLVDGARVTSATSLNSLITVGSIGDGTSNFTITGFAQYDPDEVVDNNISSGHFGNIHRNNLVEVAAIVIQADAGKRLNISIQPIQLENSGPAGSGLLNSNAIYVWMENSLLPDGVQREDANGNIIAAAFLLYSNVTHKILPGLGATATLGGRAIGLPRSIPRIINLAFGDKIVRSQGGTREIELYGDVGAEFELSVDGSDGSNLLSVENGVIPSTDKNLSFAESVFTRTIEIPSSATPKDFTVTVNPLKDTIRSGQLGDFHAGLKPMVLNQVPNPVFRIAYTRQTSPTAGYPALTETTVTGRPNTKAVDLKYISGFENIFNVTHVITTTTGNFGGGNFVEANLNPDSNTNFFQTGTITDYVAHAYNPSLVTLTNFNGTVSTTSSANDTFTLKFTVIISEFTTSDLTYQINIPSFLTHGS